MHVAEVKLITETRLGLKHALISATLGDPRVTFQDDFWLDAMPSFDSLFRPAQDVGAPGKVIAIPATDPPRDQNASARIMPRAQLALSFQFNLVASLSYFTNHDA